MADIEKDSYQRNKLRLKYNPLQLNFKRAQNTQTICEEGGLVDKEAWKEAEHLLLNPPAENDDSMASLGLNADISGNAKAMMDNMGKKLIKSYTTERKLLDRHGAKNMKEFANINRETYDKLVI